MGANLCTYRGLPEMYQGFGARDSCLLPLKPIRKFEDSCENLQVMGTTVKTWKLVSYRESSENLKRGVLKFSCLFPRKSTWVPRAETLVYFRQTSVCTKVCPHLETFVQRTPFSWTWLCHHTVSTPMDWFWLPGWLNNKGANLGIREQFWYKLLISLGSSSPYPLHPMLFIPDSGMLFPCWNSQSFHLHMEGVSHFITQAMTWTGSFRTFIVHGSWTGSKTVRIWLNVEYDTFCWQPEMEIPSFSQRTGLGPVRKSYR